MIPHRDRHELCYELLWQEHSFSYNTIVDILMDSAFQQWVLTLRFATSFPEVPFEWARWLKTCFFDKYSSPLSISKGLHLQLWGRDVRCCGWNNAGAHESRDCSRKSLFGIQNQHKNWSLAQFLFFCIVAPFKKRDSWIFGLIIVEMFRMQIYAFSRIFFHPPLLVWDPNFDPREFPHETYSYICSARIGMLVVLKQRRIPRQVV